MTGAESLLRTLLSNGVDTCFMNPGTSEMQFVAALDRVPGIRGVLCLFEGVCSGAADGYARVTGRPAATLLHLGPGLANGLANFHNARKARSPVVGIVGEHSTAHLKVDAPLTSDIQAFARTVSEQVRVTRSADDVGLAAAEAIAAARTPPGQVAMLIVPADHSWSKTNFVGPSIPPPVRRPPERDVIDRAARRLRQEGAAVLLGGAAVNPAALDAARRISASTGARIMIARNVARIATGRGRFQPPQIPYFPETALPFLANVSNMILVESEPPVSFFGYPDTPSSMLPEGCKITLLARRDEDGTAALEMLAQAHADGGTHSLEKVNAPLDDTALNLDFIGRTLAACLPEGALISEEMVSSAARVLAHLGAAAPHEFMPVTGGAIGQGLPVAIGAAIAAPGRKVVALEADGSAMYTPQALWTIARERLNVVTVIFANRRYRILDIEMRRMGTRSLGATANSMLDIARPEIDWVRVSESMGVPATRAITARQFTEQFVEALKGSGPALIEAAIE